jgi:proteasome lid subunit RPN8/RPN11
MHVNTANKAVNKKDEWIEDGSYVTDCDKLLITPFAWSKLKFFRDLNPSNEIGGFMITPQHPTLVEDIAIVKQEVSAASVDFDDDGMQLYRDEMMDNDLAPAQFERIWWHTHPSMSPNPSMIDEETFEKIFRRPSWCMMFILSSNDKTYVRVKFNCPCDSQGQQILSLQKIIESKVYMENLIQGEMAKEMTTRFKALVDEKWENLGGYGCNQNYGQGQGHCADYKGEMVWIDGERYSVTVSWRQDEKTKIWHQMRGLKMNDKKSEWLQWFHTKWYGKTSAYIVNLDKHPEYVDEAEKLGKYPPDQIPKKKSQETIQNQMCLPA